MGWSIAITGLMAGTPGCYFISRPGPNLINDYSTELTGEVGSDVFTDRVPEGRSFTDANRI